MKKLLLTTLLAIFSTGAMAEWIIVNMNEDYFLYIDEARISRKGNIARMWIMNDYFLPQGLHADTYLSKVLYMEFDCPNKMSNILNITFFTENMRKGIPIDSIKADDKKRDFILPESIGERLLKEACGKK